jgi:predicted hydrolase (HD superfamily)
MSSFEGAGKYTRLEAWNLLTEYTQSASLLKHSMAVEICMRAHGEARAAELSLGAEETRQLVSLYALTGLLHDFDYEKFPGEHPFAGNAILRDLGWPEQLRTAILAHADYSGVPRDTHMAAALFACDELSGFLTAVTLVRPTRSIHDVDAGVVRRKMKDKTFARAIKREDIESGARSLGMEPDEHITFCIQAMRREAELLGLQGTSNDPGVS